VTKLIHWNGVDIPEELRSLPAGAYVIESAEDALSEDEERGIVEALEAVRNGRGVPHEAARDVIASRLPK
jgi:hypothetical protein